MWKKLIKIAVPAFLAFSALNTEATPLYDQNAGIGYWFYQQNPKAPKTLFTVEPKSKTTPQKTATKVPKKPKKRCTSAKNWTRKCGFVTPNSFAMQAKERHELIQYMSMHPGKPDAVLNVQRYTKWVVNQALYAGNVWRLNMVNHPSLFPKAQSPISEYGIDLSMDWKHFDHQAAWEAIHKFHGQLILFTKQNCEFCHAQITPLMWFEQYTHFPIIDASIKGRCDSWFGKRCVPPKESILPAEILHVKVVPSMYLHLPGKIWIRVSAGLTTGQTLESRLYNFFLSWRLGVEHHLKTDLDGLPMDENPEQQPVTSSQVLHVLFGPGKNGKAPAQALTAPKSVSDSQS